MKKCIFFLVVFSLYGCELAVNVDAHFKHAQLVVNSIFTPDSVWSADISLNEDVLRDEPFESVDDALVVVYQNGLPIDTLMHTDDGEYKSNTGKPFTNIEYEIKVSAPGYDPVNSYAKTIPSQAQIGIETSNSISQGEPITIITFKFKDNASETNYYQFLVEEETEYYNTYTNSIIVNRSQVALEPRDAPPGDGNNYTDMEVLRNDILFNGKDVELSFKTYSLQAKSIFFTLRTLTEDYYKYKTTAKLQNDTKGDPFAQPVNVFNNINNGFGIFAGYSQSTFIQSKPQPEITAISPMTGIAGDHFIITGKNFLNSYVEFDLGNYPRPCTIVRESENQIEAIVPPEAITSKIIIYTNDQVLVSDEDFVVK